MKMGKSWVLDLHEINDWIEKQKKMERLLENLRPLTSEEEKKIVRLLENFRPITTDEEAQAFFAGVERDDDGNIIWEGPD